MKTDKIELTPEIKSMIENCIKKQNEILNRRPMTVTEMEDVIITI